MSNHTIFELPDGQRDCSCGQTFSSAIAAFDHALPLNIRSLADEIAVDPKSSPELIARSEELAQQAERDA